MGTYIERLKRSGLGRFYAKYNADRADDGAILIAWQALFSLFPLILGFLALFSFVLRDDARRQALVDAIQTQFPAQVTDLLGFMQETRVLSDWLAALSVLGLLWTGSNLFGSMALVFNQFYGATERGFIWQRLMAFSMMAIYVVLILVSIAASGVGHSITALAEQFLGYPLGPLTAWLGFAISLALSFGSAFLMFLALYRVVPNTALGLGDVWRGALLAAFLLVLLNQIFPIYLRFFGGGFEAYKTFGLFLLLMTWFYFLARIIVLGAELNAYLTGHGAASEVEAVRQRAAATGVRAASANGRAAADTPGKVILWAGLTAGVTGLTLAAAQQTASTLWRALTGEEPPRKAE